MGVVVVVHGVNDELSALAKAVSQFDPDEFDSPGLR
jgi:hypothetical protein